MLATVRGMLMICEYTTERYLRKNCSYVDEKYEYVGYRYSMSVKDAEMCGWETTVH